MISVEAVERVTQMPHEEWVGHCWGVAQAIRNSDLAPDYRLVYGSWLGDVALDSAWAQRGFRNIAARHGWLRKGNLILDPTRWTFEGTSAYIYHGFNDGTYDEGSQIVAALTHTFPPNFRPDLRIWGHEFPPECAEFIATVLGVPPWNFRQIIWLVNGPVSTLGPFVKDIYRTVIWNGYDSCIPIDAKMMVFADEQTEG